jgi:hypothetical protein
MARLPFYFKEAPRTKLLGLEAPKYTPFLLEIEVDLRIVVEEPLGSLLDVECIVVEVPHLQRGHPGGTDEQEPHRLSAETS